MASSFSQRWSCAIILLTFLLCPTAMAQGTPQHAPQGKRTFKDRVVEFQRKLSGKLAPTRNQTTSSASRIPDTTNQVRDLRTGVPNTRYRGDRDIRQSAEPRYFPNEDPRRLEEDYYRSARHGAVRQAQMQEPIVDDMTRQTPTDRVSSYQGDRLALNAPQIETVQEMDSQVHRQDYPPQNRDVPYQPSEPFVMPQSPPGQQAPSQYEMQRNQSSVPPSTQSISPTNGTKQRNYDPSYQEMPPRSAPSYPNSQPMPPQGYGAPQRGMGGQPFAQHDWSSKQLTATERALKLHRENEELQFRLNSITKLNEQLRNELRAKIEDEKKVRQAIENANTLLEQAYGENQRLKQQILELEDRAKQKAFETERIFQGIKSDLDQMLMNQMVSEKK